MPTIPNIERKQGKITGGLTGPPVTAPASGISSNTGNDLIRAATAMQDNRNKTVALDRSNEYRKAARLKLDELKADGQGESAKGVTKAFTEWSTEYSGEIVTENGAQKELYDASIFSYTESYTKQASLYEADQGDKYNKAVSAKTVSTAILDVTDSPFDTNILDESLATTKTSIAAANPGLPSDAEQNEAAEKIIASNVMAMMDSSPSAARERVHKYEKQLSGKTTASLLGMIQDKEVEQESQDKADLAIAKFPGDEAAQLKHLDKIDNAEVRAAAKQLARLEESDRKRAEESARVARINADMQAMDAAPDARATQDVIDNAAPEDKEALTKFRNGVNTEGTAIQFMEIMNAHEDSDNGMTREELKLKYMPLVGKAWPSVLSYHDNLGKTTSLKDAQLVSSISVRKTDFDPKKSEKDSELLQSVREFVQSNLAPGEIPQQEKVNKLVSTYLATGESMGAGALGLYDVDESYMKAYRAGRGAKWLPDMGDEAENLEIQALVEKQGLKATTTTLRIYKRFYKLGLPYTKEIKQMLREDQGVAE